MVEMEVEMKEEEKEEITEEKPKLDKNALIGDVLYGAVKGLGMAALTTFANLRVEGEENMPYRGKGLITTTSKDGKPMHGLNGDILVWNPVTKRRHELTSMGIRVTKETLKIQLEMSGQLDFLNQPYHQAILNDEIPLSIGGGIGQSRTYMLLLKKAHLGEVSVTVWPKILKEICKKKNIYVLE